MDEYRIIPKILSPSDLVLSGVMLDWSIFFYLICFSVSTDFHIESSGIDNVEVNDIGIRFYLEVANYGLKSVTVTKAHDPECCWEVEPGDQDCESMELYGGFPKVIDVGKKYNITYIFPNIYPLDRIGWCKFFLMTLGSQVTVHTVNFNTSTGPDIRSFMQRLFDNGPMVYRRCGGVDENPRNSCQPFICSKKYSGFRNFYREDLAKCEPVNRCQTELGKDNLPTSAFDYERNLCKSLVDHELSNDDKRTLSEIIDSSSLLQNMNPYVDVKHEDLVLECNKGEQKGTFCQCNKGWTSVMETLKDGRKKMKWCSTSIAKEKKSRLLKLSLLGLTILVAVILFLIVLYLWWRLFVREVIQGNLTGVALFFRRSKAEFTFQYNPLWVIGDKTFNTDKMLHDDVASINSSENFGSVSSELNNVKEDVQSNSLQPLFNMNDTQDYF